MRTEHFVNIHIFGRMIHARIVVTISAQLSLAWTIHNKARISTQ